MESVVKAVQKSIGEGMPKSFGLVIDGCTQATEHFLAVYACYESSDGPRFQLLSMAPIIDEPDDALNADGHAAAIARFLPFFGRSLDDVRFLVGDNCAVNKRLANLMGVPLVGCANHRLNLAVREYLAPHEDALAEVQALMRKLVHLSKQPSSAKKTALQPVLRQDTRWSSTFKMLARYFRLLCKLFDELHDVESISKKLQSDGLTLLDARDLLDRLLEVHPSFGNYLAPNAPIAHSPKFESAVVKMLGGKATRLTTAEKAQLQPFRRVAAAAAPLDDEQSTSFAERIL
ncbi:hypothetical protein F441_12480 [Phytophthora nicotianae CJ01A1]|uniref:Uncharacterized protein n=3 Tax=Phytophthora nicotianae TaxID=4792 RepID=W2GJH1_PHYNI|nr:hypothetical protein L915_12231 [Phytophthora nicotianae]ETL35760.1 hypothetical protein L916_12153 [Phytophthora nicotianae]ETP12085.1 hypothetical protein F441_12480 [Phytophthora nicotianae CJ01A1]